MATGRSARDRLPNRAAAGRRGSTIRAATNRPGPRHSGKTPLTSSKRLAVEAGRDPRNQALLDERRAEPRDIVDRRNAEQPRRERAVDVGLIVKPRNAAGGSRGASQVAQEQQGIARRRNRRTAKLERMKLDPHVLKYRTIAIGRKNRDDAEPALDQRNNDIRTKIHQIHDVFAARTIVLPARTADRAVICSTPEATEPIQRKNSFNACPKPVCDHRAPASRGNWRGFCSSYIC